MGTLGDLLVLGEGPSIVADAGVDLLGRAVGRYIRVRNQTLFFGIIHIENVKLIPTSRINFLNFPWQLPGPCRPAGLTCLMQGLHQSLLGMLK